MKKEIFIGTIPAHEESQTSEKTVSPNEVDISIPAEKECKYICIRLLVSLSNQFMTTVTGYCSLRGTNS
jgi:hypothetical protein